MHTARNSEIEAASRTISASAREYDLNRNCRDAFRGPRTGGWLPDLPFYDDPILPAPLVHDRKGEAEPINEVGGRSGCIKGGRPYLGSDKNPVKTAETYPQNDSDCDYRLVGGRNARSVEEGTRKGIVSNAHVS